MTLKTDTKRKLKPLITDITAIGTGQGKSLFAQRFSAHLSECGYRVLRFRIESERVDHELGRGETLISTERFSEAQNTGGGLAGIMEPLLVALENLGDGDALVNDYAGGTSVQRGNFQLAIDFDTYLQESNVSAWSVHLVTADIRRIRETEHLIQLAKEETPSMKRLLVCNEVIGEFGEYIDGPIGDAYRKLCGVHGTSPKITMARIEGEALRCLAPLKLDLHGILECKAVDVAKALGINRFLAQAHLTHIASWYLATRNQLDRVIPSPEASTSEPG